MGHNATLVIIADALGQIERDPQFGLKVAEAYRQMQMHPGRRVAIDSGNHSNAAQMVESHHADTTVLVAVGGNLGVPQAQVFGGNPTDREVQVRLVKRMAEQLGLAVVEKPLDAATPNRRARP
ncbi:hypothetical protein ABIC83_002932 [Roseateles asaccharophilus]|uniref:hypothetical protein n=1 Tax=Roseateles asaccharophilus TaxID=582607 RepID=UPI003833F00F